MHGVVSSVRKFRRKRLEHKRRPQWRVLQLSLLIILAGLTVGLAVHMLGLWGLAPASAALIVFGVLIASTVDINWNSLLSSSSLFLSGIFGVLLVLGASLAFDFVGFVGMVTPSLYYFLTPAMHSGTTSLREDGLMPTDLFIVFIFFFAIGTGSLYLACGVDFARLFPRLFDSSAGKGSANRTTTNTTTTNTAAPTKAPADFCHCLPAEYFVAEGALVNVHAVVMFVYFAAVAAAAGAVHFSLQLRADRRARISSTRALLASAYIFCAGACGEYAYAAFLTGDAETAGGALAIAGMVGFLVGFPATIYGYLSRQ